MVTEQEDHLLPKVRELLETGSIRDRVRFVEKDCWIGYSHAQKALLKLDNLFRCSPRQRMPNLLIIGPTNNGKTMITERFYRTYPPVRRTDEVGNKDVLVELPVLMMQMPSSPDLKRFFLILLSKLDLGAYYAGSSLFSIESALYRVLAERKVRMIIIDEIHNILSGSHKQQLEFLNLLRFIGNELKIPLVCVGTKDAYLAIRSDPQLENRFEPFIIPIWQAGKEYEALLASFVAILPLKKSSNLNDPVISAHILAKSEGIIGEITTLIRRAAAAAIYTDREVIDEFVLKTADYHSPTERRKLFEQEVI